MEEGKSDEAEADESLRGDDKASVPHSMRPSEDGGEREDEQERARARRCRVTCFKVAWCGGSDEALVSCVERCEEEGSDAIPESVVGCVEESERCGEVNRCHRQLEICEEVCGAKHHCGQWDDSQGDCQLWCAGEVWSGRLSWENQGCVVSQALGMVCEGLDVAMCGLRDAEEGAYYGD
ncbi:hypothetical protein [Lujinxingia litoralis]|uniref:hypothetical protein n=1 Tax=Lujinxingia litoralis TaxID=2211119 RepID=UPI0011B93F9B|nr:hypothetical protein [Lujinxingia litoralis]